MFGNLVEFYLEGNKVNFIYERNRGIVEVISPEIINVFVPLKREEKLSKAIENLPENKVFFEVENQRDKVLIRTEKLLVEVKGEFKVDFYNSQGELLCADYLGERDPKTNKTQDKMKIEVLKELEGSEYIYGLGDKTGHLNKKGYHYKMWNTDDPSPHVESFEAMYKSIPFLLVLKNGSGYGIFFDNPFKSYFDFGKENSKYYYFGAEDGNLDYYFIYGPSIAQVIKGYTFLTGTTPLPQLWTLGYHQSRWSYAPEGRVMEIGENFRKRDIPCDVIYLDIDYMDGFRVFTWDKEKFKDPQKMISKLKEQGFKVVTIVDPGVKKDKGYFVYDEGLEKGYFATDKDGIPYVNKVWPGDSVYPDFSQEETRKWWADKHKLLLDCGVAGIWNDMNEPASFNGPLPDDVQFKNDGYPTDHREIHNLYGHLMSKGTYEGIKKFTNKRPFVITRACFSGTQKYSTVWTGDNQSFWEHLRMSIPMLLNLGLSGFSFCGTDVGGFGFDCTGELLSRWVQVGCFTPLFRNHSAMDTRDQEPWAFDEKTEGINRKYIKLRYQLIPYLYDLMYHGEKTGLPVMRPLVLHYQQDRETYEINDQFLWGENILVAPILQQGQRARAVYLPKGRWIDYWTGEEFQGESYIIKEAPLEICPIYIKEGSVIPKFPVQNYVGERKIDNLILDIYPGNGQYLHYQDDGETFNYRQGEYNLYKITMDEGKALEIMVDMIHQGYQGKYGSFTFNINNVEAKEVIINGKPVNFQLKEGKVTFTASGERLGIKIIRKWVVSMTRGKIKKGIKGIGLFLALYFLYFLVFGVVIFNFIPPKEIDYNYSIDRFFAEKPGQDLALLLENGYQSGARKLSLIHNAQSTIDFSTYTFLGGDYTQIFIASLFQAADRGVKVRIIADGLFYNVLNHSRAISYGFMAHPNIEFKVYEPFNPLKPWVVNNRLHDKILIIDDKYAVIGGRNIGDKYVDLGPPEKFALDREVLLINTDKTMVENSVIQQFNQYFNTLWESEFAQNPRRSLTARRENKGREKMTELISFAQGKREVYPEFFAKDLSWLEEGIPTNRVTLIHNPLTRFNKQPQVWDQLTRLMEWGEERIFAQSPYVIPTRKMRNYLNLEGVNAEITILTNSLASTPNLPAFSGYTGYRKKIVDKVQEVYEYHGIGSIHGKTYVFDNRISVIGSFNLDPRSTFLSTETMVVIDSEEFTSYLMEKLEKLVEQSLLVNSDYGYYYPEKAREVPASKRIKINILRILAYPFRHML